MKRWFIGAMLVLALVASQVTGPLRAQAASDIQGSSGPQYVTAPNGGQFRIPVGSKPDAIAFFKNGFNPVRMGPIQYSFHLAPCYPHHWVLLRLNAARIYGH